MVAKIQELVDGESTSIKVVSEKDSILSVDLLVNGVSITAPPKLTPTTSASGKNLTIFPVSLLYLLNLSLRI